MAKKPASISLEDASDRGRFFTLYDLLVSVQKGEVKTFEVDRDGFIHFNDNGTQVMYQEVDNLQIPFDIVSRI